MGLDYSYVAIEKRTSGLRPIRSTCKDADKQTAESEESSAPVSGGMVSLRVEVGKGAVCNFSFAVDGKTFTTVGKPFTAREGKWIGAKVGLFSIGASGGSADFDWFRFETH
jgi:beta-xylosidase